MSAGQWAVERVAVASADYSDELADILAEAIDEQATAFPEPARFRNAVGHILARAEKLNLEELAAVMAWQRLERVFACLEHFPDKAVTIDVLRAAAHMNDERGVFMSDLARKHGWSRQRFYKRLQSVCRFLGIDYQRRKIKGRRKQRGAVLV